MQGIKFRYSGVNPSAPVAYCAFYAMNTVVEVLWCSGEEERSRSLAQRMRDIVAGLEHSLSRHLEGGPLFLLNKSERFEHVDEELFFALELCEQFREATCGYFDVAALGSSRERPACQFSMDGHNVKRVSDGILIDFGGFAKGYGAEKLRKFLCEEEGIENAIVNFGNSTVLGIGHHPLGDCWKVSPASDANICFQLRDSAVSVSGRSPEGRLHIVDPFTMSCPSRTENVVVSGRSALICEILSTALYAAPQEKHGKILENFPAYEAGTIGL